MNSVLGIQVAGVVSQSQARRSREGCFLIRLCVAILMIGLFGPGIYWSVWTVDAAETQIKILSPSPGAVIRGDSVEVRYELAKGVHATHVHCYVDGEYQRGFSGVVKGLTRGTHEIKVVAVGHDHQSIVAEARVTIEVE
ncbi:MAG: hypothetical protein HP497_03975 [Nitrospira sp.]|nr:hypothetical protein [Nitrospira sp.]